MKKINKIYIGVFAGILALVAIVYGLTVLVIVDVVPGTHCVEFGGYLGNDTGIDPIHAGCVQGRFSVGNGTNITYFNGTYCDLCINNVTITETVCGASVAPRFYNKAAVVAINCATEINASNISTCVSGYANQGSNWYNAAKCTS